MAQEEIFGNSEAWRVMQQAYEDGWHINLNTHHPYLGFHLRFSFPLAVAPDQKDHEMFAIAAIGQFPPDDTLDYMLGVESITTQANERVPAMHIDVLTAPSQRLLDMLQTISGYIIARWHHELGQRDH